MDKKLQDIHINNYITHQTKIIRAITINQIKFNTETVIIEYTENDIKMIMEIPKRFNAITID